MHARTCMYSSSSSLSHTHTTNTCITANQLVEKIIKSVSWYYMPSYIRARKREDGNNKSACRWEEVGFHFDSMANISQLLMCPEWFSCELVNIASQTPRCPPCLPPGQTATIISHKPHNINHNCCLIQTKQIPMDMQNNVHMSEMQYTERSLSLSSFIQLSKKPDVIICCKTLHLRLSLSHTHTHAPSTHALLTIHFHCSSVIFN